jgi:hypothetical protein
MLPTTAPGSDYDLRVLQNFVDAEDRLTGIPSQRKRLAILRWLVEDFQPGSRYAEAEVNRIISRRHPDFATLRRHRGRGIHAAAPERLLADGQPANVGHDPVVWPASTSEAAPFRHGANFHCSLQRIAEGGDASCS